MTDKNKEKDHRKRKQQFSPAITLKNLQKKVDKIRKDKKISDLKHKKFMFETGQILRTSDVAIKKKEALLNQKNKQIIVLKNILKKASQ
tara:strand:+ start:595 stop:861 length:267 start_codon:yes stop_codon:yes gene_type:complete